MLAVGCRTTVAAGENAIAIGKRRKHQINSLGDRLRERGCRLHLEFGAFMKIVEDALLIHSAELYGLHCDCFSPIAIPVWRNTTTRPPRTHARRHRMVRSIAVTMLTHTANLQMDTLPMSCVTLRSSRCASARSAHHRQCTRHRSGKAARRHSDAGSTGRCATAVLASRR